MGSTIAYGNERIAFKVIRNANIFGKVRIHVYPNGNVEVEAPENTPPHEIVSALRKRARWVSTQLQVHQKDREHAFPRTYQSGETHFYLGRRYVLKARVKERGRNFVKLKSGQLQVTTSGETPGEIKDTLNRWYRQKANDYFERRIADLSDELSWIDKPPTLKLRVMRTQWGNCSPTGTVCLNPRLVRAPRDCIDYVVLHELCHLQEHNHSKRFYALLDQNLASWRHTKARLDGLAELILAE